MAVEFGKYQLLRRIGAGGMGQVFLARHAGAHDFEKLLVIKRILPHLEDEEFLTMFFDEARIAARLNHPNLAQIFELGEVAGSHYLAMEYVDGEDLRRLDRFARTSGKPLPIGAILRIIADAAAGLDYAHKATDVHGQPLQLVHRDVSPQNILVGFDGAVKLIDFGVAKAAGRVQHTASGILKGKYPYMSPEQAMGEPVDGRSDVFALGIVLWELLTGKRLFKGENELMTLQMVADCVIPPPSQLRPGLPEELDALVMRVLSKDKRHRPDGAQLRLAIEELCLERHIAASSAHLVAFLSTVYAERIRQPRTLETLDTLSGPLDRELATPSVPSERVRSSNGPADGLAGARPPDSGPRASAPMGEATRSLRSAVGPKQRGLALGAAVGAVVLLGLGTAVVIHNHGADAVTGSTASTAPAVPNADIAPDADPGRRVPTAAENGTATRAGDEQARESLDAPRADISVRLQSDPPGATVLLAGKAIGITPLELRLSPGAALDATVSMTGYEPSEARLTAQSGPDVLVSLKKKATHHRAPLGIKTGR